VGAGNLFISAKNVALESLSAAAREPYHVGATVDGVEIAYEPDYTDIVVDQLKDAAIIFQNGFRVTVRTQLAEATLANLKMAWGMPDSALTSNKLSIGVPPDEPTERKLLVIGRNPQDFERRYFARRAVAVDTSSHMLRRAEATLFPVAFRLLGDPAYTGSEYGYIEDATS
jgi:hypothetical protein